MNEVRFLQDARAEFLAAVRYYDEARPGLGNAFIAEVERAEERIAAFPHSGSPHLEETRRVVLRRFPYDLAYLSDERPIMIVAVAHHRRSPGYWKDRVRY